MFASELFAARQLVLSPKSWPALAMKKHYSVYPTEKACKLIEPKFGLGSNRVTVNYDRVGGDPPGSNNYEAHIIQANGCTTQSTNQITLCRASPFLRGEWGPHPPPPPNKVSYEPREIFMNHLMTKLLSKIPLHICTENIRKSRGY